jgi:hypothetical protein
MLFRQEDLHYDSIQEAADILNESVYLTEDESLSSPIAVPVVTNDRIGAHVVSFSDVERLAEDYGVDYIDAMQAIAEANEIEMDDLAVSVPEWKIISSPDIVNELANVIVAPISSNNLIYQFCEACIEAAVEEDDARYFDLYVDTFTEADEAKAEGDGKGRLTQIKEKVQEILQKIKHHTYDRAKDKAGQAMTALKNYYTKLQDSIPQDPNQRTLWQKVKALIVSAIERISKIFKKSGDSKEDVSAQA